MGAKMIGMLENEMDTCQVRTAPKACSNRCECPDPDVVARKCRGRIGSVVVSCGLLLALLAGPATARAETTTYYVTNAQGTVVAQMDTNANVTYTATYRPYGRQQQGVPQAGPGYTGHVNDPGTGLVYMQARYYDPQVGRFLSEDPVSFSAGDIFSFNAYAYVSDNPVVNIDPTGAVEQSVSDVCMGNMECRSRINFVGDDGGGGGGAMDSSGSSFSYTGGDIGITPTYKNGVPPATGPVAELLQCTVNKCSSIHLVVTSTHEAIKQHPPGTPHRLGEAVDLRVPVGLGGQVLMCAAECGAQFGLNERTHPSIHSTAPHVHIQTVPGRLGGRGDLPNPPPVPFVDGFYVGN